MFKFSVLVAIFATVVFVSADDLALIGQPSKYSPSSPESQGVTETWTSELTWLTSTIVFHIFTPPVDMRVTTRTLTYKSTNGGSTFVEMQNKGGVFPTSYNVSSITHTNGMVILADESNKAIFISLDQGRTFDVTTVDFTPSEAKIHSSNPNQIMMYDNNEYDLYVSLDAGVTWTLILKNCIHGDQWTENGFVWGSEPYDPQGTIYAINQTDVMGGKLDRCLLSSNTFGQSWDEMRCHVLHLEINNRFITTTTPYALRVSHISNGTRGYLEQAYFPIKSNSIEKDWEVLDESGGVLFAVVDHRQVNPANGSEIWAGESNLYVSGSEGMRFTLSMKNILYIKGKDKRIKADFVSIEDLPGVFFATQHETNKSDVKSGTHRTLISVDKGSSWAPIEAPGNTRSCTLAQNCSLNLHLKEVSLNSEIQPILSATYAPGMILATGSTGKTLDLKAKDNSVYFSTDGGRDWDAILMGPHFYAFANRGSIIAAISYADPTNISYSLDYGKTFTTRAIGIPTLKQPSADPNKNKFVVTALETPPAIHGAIVMVKGYQSWRGEPVTIEIDFAQIISKECTNVDYTYWSPQSQTSDDGCWLGSRVIYTRRKTTSICIERWEDGEVPELPRSKVPCMCTKADYECDQDFTRASDGTCVSKFELTTANPDDGSGSGNVMPTEDVHSVEAIPSDCVYGKLWNYTLGYRKIVGDQCQGCAFDYCEPKPCPSNSHGELLPTYKPLYTPAPTRETVVLTTASVGKPSSPTPWVDTTKKAAASSEPVLIGVIVGVIVGTLVIGVAFVLIRKSTVQKRLKSYSTLAKGKGTYETPSFENPAFNSNDVEDSNTQGELFFSVPDDETFA